MSSESDKKTLDIRLANIESKLEALTKNLQGGELKASKEDIETYNKVLRASLATDWGDMCGINDCSKCIVVLCRPSHSGGIDIGKILPCIYECSCGPCNVDPSILARAKRAREFQSLGF